MIISGGENIDPAEIENVILSHSKVADVAVIGQASAKWGESPLAIALGYLQPRLTRRIAVPRSGIEPGRAARRSRRYDS